MNSKTQVMTKSGINYDTDGTTEIIDLRDKTTVIAPKGAPFHKEGEEVEIHPKLVDKFKAHGFAVKGETANNKK